jgi:HD-like signal output (HDOD) protein
MSVATSTLDRLVAQAGDLYSLPAVAMEILELASDAKADARKLKECIERDPALTTKILRVVNSSLFGLAQQVSDLNQALALLGMKPLKLLVLGFSLPDALFQNVAGEMLSRYWQRTLVKSIAAREISERIRSDLGDEAFIAGLLQDIGQLVLIQCVGEPYIQFVGKARGEPGDLKRLERRALGFDHVQLSAELLNRWGLPGLIVEAVAGLESSETIARTSNPLIRVLDLAELVATLLCDGHTVVLAELAGAACFRDHGSTSL